MRIAYVYEEDSAKDNDCSCFDVTQDGLIAQTDSVRDLGLINQTTPATGPFGAASQIAFTKDEKNIVVTVKRTFEDDRPGFLAVWPIDAAGKLAPNYTQIPTPSSGGAPFSLTPIANASAFLATDFDVGVDVFDFAQGLPAVSSNRATLAYPIANQSAICWAAWSNATGSFYVTDFNTGVVSEIAVDPSTLNMTFVADYYTQENAGLIDLEVASLDGNE